MQIHVASPWLDPRCKKLSCGTRRQNAPCPHPIAIPPAVRALLATGGRAILPKPYARTRAKRGVSTSVVGISQRFSSICTRAKVLWVGTNKCMG